MSINDLITCSSIYELFCSVKLFTEVRIFDCGFIYKVNFPAKQLLQFINEIKKSQK